MSADSTVPAGTAASYPEPDVLERSTLIIGTRLMLAANSTLMIAMIFTYLYLRSQNYNSMWRPAGIADLSSVPVAIMLLLQLVSLVLVVAALGRAGRGVAVRPLVAAAFVVALVAGGLRVWYQYNLGSGWVINNGTYTATSEMWFGILIVEILLGCVWLLSLVVPSERTVNPVTAERHLRAFAEYWGYLLAASTFVWLLVRLV